MSLSNFLSFLLNELTLLPFFINKDGKILARFLVVSLSKNEKIQLQQRTCLKPTVFCKIKLLF